MLVLVETASPRADAWAKSFRRRVPKSQTLQGPAPDSARHWFDSFVRPLMPEPLGVDPRESDAVVVCQNWHLSRRAIAINDMIEFRWLEGFLASRGAIVVIPPVQVKQAHGVVWSKPSIPMTNATHSQLPVNIAPAVSRIMVHATVAAHRAQPLVMWPEYVGSRTPGILMVMPKSARALAGDPRDGQTRRVLSTLPDKAWESGVGFVYAADPHQPKRLGMLWHLLGKPAVVTVGKNASHCANLDGVPHTRAPHPLRVDREKFARSMPGLVQMANNQATFWRGR